MIATRWQETKMRNRATHSTLDNNGAKELGEARCVGCVKVGT